jgi:hypothetical protein
MLLLAVLACIAVPASSFVPLSVRSFTTPTTRLSSTHEDILLLTPPAAQPHPEDVVIDSIPVRHSLDVYQRVGGSIRTWYFEVS